MITTLKWEMESTQITQIRDNREKLPLLFRNYIWIIGESPRYFKSYFFLSAVHQFIKHAIFYVLIFEEKSWNVHTNLQNL